MLMLMVMAMMMIMKLEKLAEMGLISANHLWPIHLHVDRGIGMGGIRKGMDEIMGCKYIEKSTKKRARDKEKDKLALKKE